MDRRTIYAVFYILLLTMTVPALCVNIKLNEEEHHRERRFAVAALPLYAGIAVSPWVWAILLAAYGIAALRSYSISRGSSDNHSCANNRGWCRNRCFSHEYEDYANSPVCGYYKCCRPGNFG